MSDCSDSVDDMYGSDAESVASEHGEPVAAAAACASSGGGEHSKASSAPRIYPAPFGDDRLAFVGDRYTVLGRQVRPGSRMSRLPECWWLRNRATCPISTAGTCASIDRPILAGILRRV